MEEKRQGHKWPKGYCPNPSGRPRGSRNKPVDVSKDVLLEAQKLEESGLSAQQMLDQEMPRIMAGLIAHALRDPDKKLRVKCSALCVSLKNLDGQWDRFRHSFELTDKELVCLGMELQSLKQISGKGRLGKPGKGNGGEPILIEGSASQEPGENQIRGEGK